MKNIFRYKSFVAAALLAMFASCSDDDDVTNTARLDKPVVTAALSGTTVTEGGEITVTLTSSKAINTFMEFKLDLLQEGSTASFRDFTSSGDETSITTGAGTIGYTITIPAYTTEYTFTINPVIDFNVEGTETLNFRFYPEGNSRGSIAEGSEFFTITVNDYVSNDVGVRLSWDGSYADAFGTIVHPTYTAVNAQGQQSQVGFDAWDFDVYVLDVNSFDDVTGFAGATGNQPEEVVVSEDLADGDYLIVADLYAVGATPLEPFSFDIFLDVTKFGTWTTKIPLNYTSASAPSGGSGLGNGATIVATLTKAGTTWTLTDYETNTVLATGRKAQLEAAVKRHNIGRKKK